MSTSKLQLLRCFLTERLTAAAVEIFGEVESVVEEYREENKRLQQMLNMLRPEIKLHRADQLFSASPPMSIEQSSEQRASLAGENPEPWLVRIKEEQEEHATSPGGDGVAAVNFILTPATVKSDVDQDSSLPQLSHTFHIVKVESNADSESTYSAVDMASDNEGGTHKELGSPSDPTQPSTVSQKNGKKCSRCEDCGKSLKKKVFVNNDSDSEDEFFGFGEDNLDMAEREDERDVAEEQQRGRQEEPEEWRQMRGGASQAERAELPTFDGARCGAQRVWSSKDPYDFFRGLFSPAIIEKISVETNRYAESILASRDLAPQSRFHEWKPTTPEELEKFLGVQVAMGLCTKPSIPNYWNKDPQHLNWTPNYSRVMPRKRYELLNSFLHFNDNSLRREKGHPNYDPLFKIRPLVDAVLLKFREEYYPHQNLSIEESMVSFRGRVFFRQYIPSKRVRFGMKGFVLTDSHTNYTYLWDVYTGGAFQYNREMGIGYSNVTHLMEEAGLLGKGHIVYTDTFYTSPALFIHLHEQGTGACGTVRSNRRGLPPQLRDLNLRPADPPVFYEKNPLLASSFRDAGTVTVLSTVHDASVITKRVRSKGPTGHREVVKPKCVEYYNRCIGGVDRSDQQCSYYSFTHQSMKWYIRLYHHVIEVALMNAHILFREATGIVMPTPDFRSQVVAGLLGRTLKDASPLLPTPTPDLRNQVAAGLLGHTLKDASPLPPRELPGVPARLSERHFLDQREGSKPDCRVCSNRKRRPAEGSNKKTGRRQTPYFCKTCPEKPALCPVPCFEMYHTKVVYK